VAGLTIFFSLAIVTKFSALALGPLVFCLLVVAVRMRPQFEARTAAAIVVLLAVASYVAIWAISGFRYLPSDNPAWSLHLEDLPLAHTVPELARVTRWIDDHRLLPNMVTEGFLVFAQSMLPPNYTFLAGEYSDRGWWYYFPVAFLLKTPISFIALLFIGLFVCLRERQRLGSLNEAFLLLPVAIYLFAAINNTFQVGVRHILPLYPYFIMLTAAAAMMLSRRPVGRVMLGGLTIAWAASLISVYPYTLTYFNRFAGGPGNGYKYLADSNIDWGQGLKELKAWMDEQHVPTIALAYFGTADPDYYGITHTRLPAAAPGYEPSTGTPRGRWTKPALPGYVAVGATVLTGVYDDPHWMLFYEGLRKVRPTAVIGNSVFVYRLERWPEPDTLGTAATATEIDAERRLGDELMKVEWFSRAIVHYRRYLEHRANEPAVLTNLGYALMMTDQLQDAATVLRRAIALSPDSGLAHMVLSTALLNARGNVGEIVEHARQAARVLPADPTALLTLGRALAISGQFREAEAVLSRVLTIAPQEAAAHELLQRIRTRSRQIG
jgi:hypothetical protein